MNHSVGLYARTLRYLRAEQIIYQAWYRVRGRPAGRPVEDGANTALPDFASLQQRADFLPRNGWDPQTGRFHFLNAFVEFKDRPVDWLAPDKSRLWRYNLHYFDYLQSPPTLPPDVALPLMREWAQDNPTGTPDSWDPFPVSLRLVNWIKYLSRIAVPRDETAPLVCSLREQALWLERSLERHLLANHFFKNLKALIFAGLFFQGKDADRWRAKGIAGLQGQLDEQILADGGHFERSPMYHSMILEDCLDLLNVCAGQPEPKLKELSSRLEEAAGRMARFLSGVLHPDSQIPLFNDAAFGIEADSADLFDYYERALGKPISQADGTVRSFPDSGYFVMQPKADNFLIIDGGPIGPDYQPGHAHCDTLSFELSLSGRRVIVDSGCYEYEDTDIRRYNRGNAGHNTVTIDGENQSEVWGRHRCGRRAYPLYARLSETPDGSLRFEGAHDGYRWLPGKPIHHREVLWAGKTLLIKDRVKGARKHDVELRLHINPELEIEAEGPSVLIKDKGAALARISGVSDRSIRMDTGWYCPEFGIKNGCQVLTIRHESTQLPMATGWRFDILK